MKASLFLPLPVGPTWNVKDSCKGLCNQSITRNRAAPYPVESRVRCRLCRCKPLSCILSNPTWDSLQCVSCTSYKNIPFANIYETLNNYFVLKFNIISWSFASLPPYKLINVFDIQHLSTNSRVAALTSYRVIVYLNVFLICFFLLNKFIYSFFTFHCNTHVKILFKSMLFVDEKSTNKLI